MNPDKHAHTYTHTHKDQNLCLAQIKLKPYALKQLLLLKEPNELSFQSKF